MPAEDNLYQMMDLGAYVKDTNRGN